MDFLAKLQIMSASSNSDSLELILDGSIQKLLDSFATAMQVRIVLYGRDGKLLRQGRDEGNCRFCQLVQECFTIQPCLALDRQWQRMARQTGACQLYVCHAGLYEAIMPVLVGQDLLGYVVFGQLRSTATLSALLLETFPAPRRNALKKAFASLPRVSEERIHSLAELLKVLVDYIVRNELVRRGGHHLYHSTINYIEEHLAAPITLADAARYLNLSVSSLSHFLQAQGTTFKRLLIEKRLSAAEELLRQPPGCSVKEAAARTGFSDPGYFSRVFRKYRGYPPSQQTLSRK